MRFRCKEASRRTQRENEANNEAALEKKLRENRCAPMRQRSRLRASLVARCHCGTVTVTCHSDTHVRQSTPRSPAAGSGHRRRHGGAFILSAHLGLLLRLRQCAPARQQLCRAGRARRRRHQLRGRALSRGRRRATLAAPGRQPRLKVAMWRGGKGRGGKQSCASRRVFNGAVVLPPPPGKNGRELKMGIAYSASSHNTRAWCSK